MAIEGIPPVVRSNRAWLKRLSRISAWALLASVVILVLSGWGITQTGVIYNLTFGLVDRRLADAIHRNMNFPLAVFFLLHAAVNIRMMINARRFLTALITDLILIFVSFGILGIFIYMEYFRLGG